MEDKAISVRLVDGQAEVCMGTRSFMVARRDTDARAAFCPIELVVAALGSWMTLTIAAVAEHKAIALDKVDVSVSHTIEEGRPWRTVLKVRIDLGAGLTKRERKILFHVSRSCEVSKMLTGEVACDYELV